MLKTLVNRIKGVFLKGSATIEACVVVPIAMVIIIAVIYLAYYVHDETSMTASNDFAVMEYAKGTGIKDSKRLIWASNVSAGISGGKGKAGAYSYAQFRLPFELVIKMMDPDISILHSEINISGLEPRKKLLLYKSICDGAGNIIGNISSK